MKHVYRLEDGAWIKEFKSKKCLIQPEDCYVSNIEPQFGYDIDLQDGCVSREQRLEEEKSLI